MTQPPAPNPDYCPPESEGDTAPEYFTQPPPPCPAPSFLRRSVSPARHLAPQSPLPCPLGGLDAVRAAGVQPLGQLPAPEPPLCRNVHRLELLRERHVVPG